MRLAGGALLIAALLGLGPLLDPGRADASLCDGGRTPEKARLLSDAVFLGRVMAVVKDADGIIVTFEVGTVWKGSVFKTTFVADLILADPPRPRVHSRFDEGSTYIVYAWAYEETLFVLGCNRVMELTRANEDLAELGEGAPPHAGATSWWPAPNSGMAGVSQSLELDPQVYGVLPTNADTSTPASWLGAVLAASCAAVAALARLAVGGAGALTR